MSLLRRRKIVSLVLLAACGALTLGCASPGPPHPPSLRLPQPVRDLDARRIGDTVELRFTVPSQSTDKLPLRGGSVRGVICRELEHLGCVAVAGLAPPIHTSAGDHNVVTWRDSLPPALRNGPPRLMSYRIEFFNQDGRSAGKSDAAYTVAGSPPPVVTGLHVEGSRLGVVIRWAPASPGDGEVLLRREDLSPKPPVDKPKPPASTAAKPGSHSAPTIVWLQTNAKDGGTLDTAAQPGALYSYTAARQRVAQIGGRSLPYRSADSEPVPFTLQQIYPPLPPSGLTAAGFEPVSGGYAVDLIWQPGDDTGLLAGMAGYNVYRETLDAGGRATDRSHRLNPELLPLPGFHDATAKPGQRYRYSVTAVDNRGNESGAAKFVLEPSPQ